jgi:MerR family transcriptional regulator, light-induced transcriptional regulator
MSRSLDKASSTLSIHSFEATVMISNPHTNVNTPLFTAGEVEERSGIPATTLRQWERRYGLPNPQRTASGYRLYSQNDLVLIEFFKARIAEGISVSRAAQLYALEQSLPSAHKVTPKIETDQPSNQLTPPMGLTQKHSAFVSELVASTLTGDSAKADRILSHAHATMPVEGVVLEVIQPTLIEIGERWHRGEITIAHEHQATNYLRGKLHHLLELAGNSRHGPTVVLACPPGEWHEIGALAIAIFLRRAGIRTHYLGANTPIPDLARFAREVSASAIMVSASAPDVIEGFRAQAHLLREVVPHVIYGGYAFSQNPRLAAELGGEFAGHSAADALEFVLKQLEPNPPTKPQSAVWS